MTAYASDIVRDDPDAAEKLVENIRVVIDAAKDRIEDLDNALENV